MTEQEEAELNIRVAAVISAWRHTVAALLANGSLTVEEVRDIKAGCLTTAAAIEEGTDTPSQVAADRLRTALQTMFSPLDLKD